MKKIILLFLFLVVCKPAPPPAPAETPDMAYRDVVLATRPLHMAVYHEFNGNLNDSGPHALVGATGTDITYSLNGIDGTRTAVFNGTSSYVDLGVNFRAAIDGHSMDGLTVLVWVAARDDTVWPQASLKTAFSMISSGADLLEIFKPLLGRQLAAALIDGTNNVTGGLIPTGGNFYMVALTVDADEGVGRVYVNDTLTNEVVYGGGAWSGTLTSSQVGRRTTGSYWDGRIDELTVWGQGLTAEEITAIYNAGAAEYTAVPPVTGSEAVVQIFDRTGVPIGEILPLIDFVSWRRNEIGQAVFALAKSDAKANDTYLRAQNRVLIIFDNGLPPWGGVMQPDFVIDHDTITVKALTGESLLGRRLTDRGRYFDQQTIGQIATILINEANAIVPMGITLGDVWLGGTNHSPAYHYKDLLEIFQGSLFKRLSTADFYVTPVVESDGRLTFRLSVVERRGQNMTGVALHQGLNVVDPTRVGFTGPVINRWVIIGDGNGWGADRPVAIAEDAESIARHGLLEKPEIHQGVIYQETLQATADNLLAETAWPRVLLDITAVDLPPATFEQYDIGDNLPVELPDYGIGSSFVGAATVQARAFYPQDGRLNLVLEATENA